MYFLFLKDNDTLYSIMKILPDYYFPTITDIPLSLFHDKGIKGIAIDIDNTLTADGSLLLSERVVFWLDEVRKQNISICIVSNNHKGRIEPFADIASLDYICEADKPSRKNKDMVLERLGRRADEVVMIGDQIFTDMLFAHRCGFFSILVDPIAEDKHRGASIKRFFERPLKHILRGKKR